MLPARFVLCCTSVLLVQPVTVLFAAQIAAASPVPIHTTEGGRSPFHEPNAVLLNVTQADLNRILQGTVRSLGGPVFEGHSSHPTKNMFDLRYRVDVSDPVLKLGADGEVDVAFSIREASLDVGRYERRSGSGKKAAYCENLGVRVDRAQPVDVSLGLRFAYEGGDLKILPDRVSIPDAEKRIRLVEPTRCEGTLVPRRILWWIGKPALKHRLKDLDEMLLANLKKTASRMHGANGEGLLGNRLEIGARTVAPNGRERKRDGKRNRKADLKRPQDIFVYPREIDTGHGSVFVTLTASSSRSDVTSSVPEWAASFPDRSYMALSESFLSEVGRYAFAGISELSRKPGGKFAKLVKSDSLLSLVPGLRDIEKKRNVYFTFKTSELPDVELHRIGELGPLTMDMAAARIPDLFGDSEKRAMILARVSGIEVEVWQAAEGGDRWLGSLKVDSGRVGLVPYANPLGGVSFEMLENDWKVSSEGIEFDEDLFEATLQELVFGEIFETRYAPLFREGIGAGNVKLMPRTFRVAGDHLVIVFG